MEKATTLRLSDPPTLRVNPPRRLSSAPPKIPASPSLHEYWLSYLAFYEANRQFGSGLMDHFCGLSTFAAAPNGARDRKRPSSSGRCPAAYDAYE
jgi:hypothetical protein